MSSIHTADSKNTRKFRNIFTSFNELNEIMEVAAMIHGQEKNHLQLKFLILLVQLCRDSFVTMVYASLFTPQSNKIANKKISGSHSSGL